MGSLKMSPRKIPTSIKSYSEYGRKWIAPLVTVDYHSNKLMFIQEIIIIIIKKNSDVYMQPMVARGID